MVIPLLPSSFSSINTWQWILGAQKFIPVNKNDASWQIENTAIKKVST